jgi:hypothetical protein
MDPADSHAYDAAVECAALCMIALGSPAGDVFRQHMREALREALYLRGALYENERLVDGFAARNVLNEVVARVMSIFSHELAPILGADATPENGDDAELALSECLRAVLIRIDEMCLSEH